MKTAFLFPGQGAQYLGMGKDIYEKYEIAKEIYDKVEKLTNIDIKKICFEGPEEELMKTENTQLAILTTSLAILRVLEENGVTADVTAGLSLGEYTALIYGGYLSFEDGVKLIQKRGYLMGNYLPNENYEMSAVIGLESEKIEEICNSIDEFVVPANYNSKMQTVISGSQKGIEEATEKLKEAGAKKIVKLKTSGPFHTIKLEKAKEMYEKELQKINFKSGNQIKVVRNIDGEIYKATDDFKDILAKHIFSPVRFDKIIDQLKKEKIERVVEIGPGKVLTGFIKKDYPEAEIFNINNLENLEKFIQGGTDGR